MIIIGLTGSIGMGKSTAATMLQHLGVPVHDSDADAHELLRPDSPAREAFAAAFPYFRYPQIYRYPWPWQEGKRGVEIDRKKLGNLVFKNDTLREKLEAVLHPFIRRAQDNFIRRQRKAGRDIAALDIPLLFETGADLRVDYTINVSAPASVQYARVLERPGMNDEKFFAILQRQIPDGEKNARADFIVHSGLGRAYMMKELKKILAHIKKTAA